MSHDVYEPASAVARRLFSSLGDGRWLDAAACIDPADLHVQYEAAVALKLRSSDDPKFAAVDREASSESPISRSARQALLPRARLPFPWSVLGAMSLEELKNLSALDLMARIMEIREAEFLDEQQGRPERLEWAAEPVPAEPASELLRVVLGEVQESDVVSHVLFRRVLKLPHEAYLLEPIGCVTFRKLSDGWRVALSKLAGAKPGIDAGPWRALAELRSAWL